MEANPTQRFGHLFTGRTLRIDTSHGGRRTAEWIRLEHVAREGKWSGGQPTGVPTPLGDYRCDVREASSGNLLFSSGYSSFFEEWRSTRAALSDEERSFSESVRIPEPRTDVRVSIEGRNDDGTFRTLLDVALQPSRAKDARPEPTAEPIDIDVAADPGRCVNLLFVAEGYVEREREKFIADVERSCDLLFQVEPYRSKRSIFNVRGVFAASEESGISDPTQQRTVKTFLGASFDVFGIARYMLTFENEQLRRAAACAPYDCLVVLCNCDTYGGGGVFNQYACVAADAPHAQYLIAHELGHSFAGLADEYYTSLVTYEVEGSLPCEPWNPNVALSSDRSTLRWKHLVDPDVPLPTPWQQEKYDELAAQARKVSDSRKEPRQSRALARRMTSLLEENPYYGRVGAFEGALYRASGVFRPEVDCLMFSRSHSRFCRVCQHAIEQRIENVSRAVS